MTFLLSLLGVLLIIEGIPYFAFPIKAKGWALSLNDIPNRALRIMGCIAMAFGLLLLFVAAFLT